MSFNEKNGSDNPEDWQVKEPQPDYEKAELDVIRDSLKRSYDDRFKTMMSLIKVSIMLKNAKVTHQPDDLSKY